MKGQASVKTPGNSLIYLDYIFLALIILPLIIITVSVAKKRPAQITIISSIVTSMLIVVATMTVARINGVILADRFMDWISELAAQAVAQDAVPGFSGGILTDDEKVQYLISGYDTVNRTMPAFLLCFSVLYNYFAYMFISFLFRAAGKAPVRLRHFAEFRWAPQFIDYMFGMIIISFALDHTAMFANSFLFDNMYQIFSFCTEAQGLAVVFMICAGRGIPKIVAVLFGGLAILSPMLRFALFIIGMLEYFMHLRMRMVK